MIKILARALLVLLLISLLGLTSIVLPTQSAEAATLSFTELGTHPQAAAQSTSTGKTINKLQIFDGKLYAGYGDWNANTGPIEVNPFNLTTNEFEGSVISVPTEAIQNWKIINGKLYASTIDPTCSGNCPGGYVVGDADGNWEVKTPVTTEHVLDIATLTGTDLWLFGSAGGATATAWRSTDDGDNWEVVQTMTNEPGGDNSERYYWGAALHGKMYMQSNYAWYNPPVQSFDGTDWSNGITNELCPTPNSGSVNPVVFMDKIVCKGNSKLNIFDGTDKSAIDHYEDSRYPLCGSSDGDIGTTSTHLYVLCRNWNGSGSFDPTKLIRSNNLEDWRELEGMPEAATSFTVDEDNNRIYVGTSDSKIYVSDLPAVDATNPTVSVTTPSAGTTVKEFLSISASASDNDAISRVEFYLDGELIDTKTTAPYTTTWHNRYGTNGWQTTSGQHTITAKAYDYEGNSATSSAVNITVVDPDGINITTYATGNSLLGPSILGFDTQGNLLYSDVHSLDIPYLSTFKKLDFSTTSVSSYTAPEGIIVYPTHAPIFADNKWWFADCENSSVKSVAVPSMTLEEFSMEQYSVCQDGSSKLAATPDGTVYHYGRGDHINKISTDGIVSQIALPPGSDWLSALNTTPDGHIIMNIGVDNGDDTYSNTLARINQSGETETYYSHIQVGGEDAIAGVSVITDKDGNTWVGTLPDTEHADILPILTRISPSGVVTRYDNPDGKVAFNLMAAPNGDIWYKTFDGLFAKLNPSTGVTKSYKLLTPASEELLGDEAAGFNAYMGYYAPNAVMDSEGNIWIGDSFGNRILKISATSSEHGGDGINEAGSSVSNESTGTTTSIQLLSSQVAVANTGDTAAPDDNKITLNHYIQYLQGAGRQLSLKVGDTIYFFVSIHGRSEEHSATIKEIGKDYVIITFRSKPFDVRLMQGETGKYDVDGDGNDDIQATLDSIGVKQANITFKQLAIAPNPIAASEPVVPKVGTNNSPRYYLIPLALFAVVLLVTIGKKKRSSNHT